MHRKRWRLDGRFFTISAAALLAVVGAGWHSGQVTAATMDSLSPMAAAHESSNWAVYANVVSPSSPDYAFTAVSGNFTMRTIQTPTGKSNAFAAFWIGLDGFNSSTVEQTGILARISSDAT